jgi:GPH family glycoside/pentoside/hexuronide:cation symporter
MQTHKLTRGQRVAFGFGKFGSAIFMQVVTIATVYIYGSAFQLDYKLNAIGNAVGKIVIAFSGFIFGYISDILKNPRWGRRKFFVWTGAPILAISFVMLFIPHYFIPLDKEILVFVWLLVWYALFNLFYGYLTTPYQAWMPEVTTEDDRVGMSAIQNTTNLFATIGGLAFAFVFSGMLDAEIDKVGPTAILGPLGIILLVAVLIFAVVEVLAFLPVLLSVKEEPVERKERNIVREFKVVLTNKNYVLWFITQGIYSMGLTILTALTFDLIGFLGLTGMTEFAIFAAAMFGTTMLSFILWERLSKRIGKKVGLLISYGCLIAILPLTLVLGKIPLIPDDIETFVFGILLGFGLSTTYLFPNAIIGDLADEDERITKESRAGMYTGFNSIPLNIFQATAYLLVPLIYNPEPGATYWGLQWLGPIVAIFFLLSIPTIIIGNYDPFLEDIRKYAGKNFSKVEEHKIKED